MLETIETRIIPRERVTVIAGGWSAADIDKSNLPGTVIGVNDACVHAPCGIAISMDRLWTENRWTFLQRRGLQAFIRRPALANIETRPQWLHSFECDYRSVDFSERIEVLNGTNSGFCGLNLAYLMRPRQLFLLGFDMNRNPANGSPYWYPVMPWAKPGGATSNGKYNEWAGQFDAAAASFRRIGTEVLNVSKTSAIDVFKKIDKKEFERTIA